MGCRGGSHETHDYDAALTKAMDSADEARVDEPFQLISESLWEWLRVIPVDPATASIIDTARHSLAEAAVRLRTDEHAQRRWQELKAAHAPRAKVDL